MSKECKCGHTAGTTSNTAGLAGSYVWKLYEYSEKPPCFDPDCSCCRYRHCCRNAKKFTITNAGPRWQVSNTGVSTTDSTR